MPTRTSSAPPDGQHDSGNFTNSEGFLPAKTNAWINPPHMKDQSAGGNNLIQGNPKDLNIPGVMVGAPITGPVPTGVAPGIILVAPSSGPIPGSPVVIINGAPSMPLIPGQGQPIAGIMVQSPQIHMGHQGGHEGGDRDNHSYNGQPGSEVPQGQGQGQGNNKQISPQMIRPQMNSQMPPQMQQQQMMYHNNSPMGQGGRPLQGMQMMIPSNYPLPYFPNGPNQPSQQMLYVQGRGYVLSYKLLLSFFAMQ